jgi:uncharacterized protein
MNIQTTIKPQPAKKKAKGGGSLKGEVFRQSRIWHGYLSAFAFIALIFFSITGLLLNHPAWFEGREEAPSKDTVLTLAPADLARARAAAEPGPILAKAVGDKVDLIGAYKSAETIDNEVMLSFESVKGRSDVTVNLDTGRAEAAVERSDAVTVLNELHRGKNSGAAWAWVIDVTAILVLVLSIIGYVLFFSLRFRLRTSLALTGISLAALAAIFVFLIP